MTQPNMTVRGMQRWMDSDAWAAYRRYRDRQRYRGYVRIVSERALAVIRGTATAQQEQKVNQYLSRAVPQFRSSGAGAREFGGVAANVCALRNWGYDPYGTYR